MQVRACSALRVGLDSRGWPSPTVLRAEAPLLLRVTDQSADRLTVHLVGGAAGPLGGDHLDFDLAVGSGARLTVRSVAASLAQPGRECESVSTVRARVAAGASLDWWPQPLLSIAGSSHTIRTVVDVDRDVDAETDAETDAATDAATDAGRHQHATIRWVDEVVLGRSGEKSGNLVVDQRFTVAGIPLVCHRTTFDPLCAGAGRHGLGRSVITAIVLGSRALEARSVASSTSASMSIARYPISATATSWIGLGDDIDELRAKMVDEFALGHRERSPFAATHISRR